MDKTTFTVSNPSILEIGDKVETPFFSRESWPLVDRAVYENKKMICIITEAVTATEVGLKDDEKMSDKKLDCPVCDDGHEIEVDYSKREYRCDKCGTDLNLVSDSAMGCDGVFWYLERIAPKERESRR